MTPIAQKTRRANERVSTGATFTEEAAESAAPAVFIVSNGSKWAGDELDTLDELLAMLGREVLDPKFEEYGNFIHVDPVSSVTETPLLPPGWVSFWGNFFTWSHVFQIVTNDSAVIEELTKAIRNNQAGARYASAKIQINAEKNKRAKELKAYLRK